MMEYSLSLRKIEGLRTALRPFDRLRDLRDLLRKSLNFEF